MCRILKPKKSGFKAGVIITTALGKTMQVLITYAFQGVSSSSCEAVNITKKSDLILKGLSQITFVFFGIF